MSDRRGDTYDQIRRRLLDGAIRTPRDLSRRRLAAALQVDASEVQWALRRMQAEGLLESRPQSGTFVRRVTPQEFRNLHDIRKLVEPYAAARAARLITPDLLSQMEQSVHEMDSLSGEIARLTVQHVPDDLIQRIIRLETAFHGSILAAAQNPEAMRIVEHAQIFAHLTRFFPDVSRELLLNDAQVTVAGHRAIFEAIRQGNARQARRCMKEHLANGLTLLRPDPTNREDLR